MEKKVGHCRLNDHKLSVYTVADYIVSPLGLSTEANFESLQRHRSGISAMEPGAYGPDAVHAAKIPGYIRNDVNFNPSYTYLENLIIHSIGAVLNQLQQPFDIKKCVFILSSTKGNIDLLDDVQKAHFPEDRWQLPSMAEVIRYAFQFENNPVVVSNACISGVSAMLTAQKLIVSQRYDHAIVVGADMLSEFVVSGFQSFMAISEAPCRPYDASRNGISLGEAVATVVLSNDPEIGLQQAALSKVAGGGQSNDANHISGPSRTGEGLQVAVRKALEESKLTIDQIGYINAHGTATQYNDEMEAQAFNSLGGQDIPLNSLKGYYGHTLGASGTLESVLTIRQMNKGLLFQSKGFEEMGLTKPLNVLDDNKSMDIKAAMKTSSGFGGCNAAIIFEQV